MMSTEEEMTTEELKEEKTVFRKAGQKRLEKKEGQLESQCMRIKDLKTMIQDYNNKNNDNYKVFYCISCLNREIGVKLKSVIYY